MSLLRLLTAGRSLVGLKKSETRYHLSQHRLLPKFAAKKNPFGNSKDETQRGGGETAARPQEQTLEESASVPVRAETPGKPETIVPIPELPTSTHVSAPNCGANSLPERRSLLSALGQRIAQCASPMGKLLFWRRTRASAPAIVRFNKPLIQGELSLERVKVVRNDLSDTDLEIVRSKPQTVAPEPSPELEKERPEPQPARNRLPRTLFPAGKT
jgi:hypothetical protein